MSSLRLRRRLGCLAASIPLVLIFAVAAAVPAGAAATGSSVSAEIQSGTLVLSGDAFGTLAKVGATVKSGKTAPVAIGGGGCTLNGQQLPIHAQNSVASVSIPSLSSGTGVITTTADASQTPNKVVVRTSADVHEMNLLGGLITASEVTAVSQTSFNGTNFRTSEDGSGFVDLVVAGTAENANVPPNTTVALPGIGEVVLNEVSGRQGTDSAELTVNMIHVHVTQENAFGYPVGSDIIVAHANSAVKQLPSPVIATLDGKAYGTSAHGKFTSPVKAKLDSGPSAPVVVPCLGTGGKVRTNFVANVVVPSDGSVLSATTINTTAQGTVSSGSASAETTATVQTANVLGSLVQASVVKADAHASSTGGSATLSDAGSSFGTLSVNGHPEIGADVPPNTEVTIAGVGTLWLHRVIQNSKSIEVRMIEMIVTVKSNPFGLAVGTDIRVAVASASVHNV